MQRAELLQGTGYNLRCKGEESLKNKAVKSASRNREHSAFVYKGEESSERPQSRYRKTHKIVDYRDKIQGWLAYGDYELLKIL